jgi:hypothetical protein
MKKFKVSMGKKRAVVQLVLLSPLVILAGVDFIPLLLFILGATAIYGLVMLYGSDPYFKDNEERLRALNVQRMGSIWRRVDPFNLYLGFGSLSARQRHLKL